METYVIVPLWLGLWLFGFLVADVLVRRKRNPSFKNLLLHLRIWELTTLFLLYLSFTVFEKTSILHTMVLVGGPFFSIIPISLFFVKRRSLLSEK